MEQRSATNTASVQMFALLLGRQAQNQLEMIANEPRFQIVQVVNVALESSGEKRRVVVASVE
jgi:hypothetical protein